jgi:hypothetical protein
MVKSLEHRGEQKPVLKKEQLPLLGERELEPSDARLNPEELRAFHETYEAFEIAKDNEPVLAFVEPETTSELYEKAKLEFSIAFEKAYYGMLAQCAEDRRELVQKMMAGLQTVLETLDLETKEKVLANCLTIVWGSGILVGIAGIRPEKVSREGVVFKPMDYTERLSYIAGDVANFPFATTAIDTSLRKMGASDYIERAGTTVRNAAMMRVISPLLSYMKYDA